MFDLPRAPLAGAFATPASVASNSSPRKARRRAKPFFSSLCRSVQITAACCSRVPFHGQPCYDRRNPGSLCHAGTATSACRTAVGGTRDARSVNGRDLLGACAGWVGPLAGLDSLSIGYGQCRIDFTVETSSDRSIGPPLRPAVACASFRAGRYPPRRRAGRHDHAPRTCRRRSNTGISGSGPQVP